ncbi:MAG TPA: hypothetical protein V6D30_01055 [Leptolyngbyaceae cyanobacterium]
MLPVLCLDDFESLLKGNQEFNNELYDNLRSLVNDNALKLVVASRKELSVQCRILCNLDFELLLELSLLLLLVILDASNYVC